MAETLGKHAGILSPPRSRAVVDRLIKSYWAGALHCADVKRIMRNTEVAFSRLEQAVEDEDAGER